MHRAVEFAALRETASCVADWSVSTRNTLGGVKMTAKTTKPIVRFFSFVLVLFGLAACGGGGGGGGNPSNAGGGSSGGGGGGASSNAIPPVPTGTPVIYLATSADASSYFPGNDIYIKANNQATLRYIPATGAIALMETNYSPSYARSALLPFTQGDRLFSINYSLDIDRFDLYPIDLHTNAHTKDLYFSDKYPSRCIALVGDDLIYSDSVTGTWKKLSKVSTATAGASPVTIGPATGPNRCFLNLANSNGRLLDVEFIDNPGTTPDEYIVHEHDTDTGAVNAAWGDFVEALNPGNYGWYNFAFDGSYLYIVRKVISDGTIQVERFEYTAPGATPALRATLTPTASFTGPYTIDVHNGFIAMLAYDGTSIPYSNVSRLLTYDDNTGEFRDIVVGNSYYAVQVLYLP
jgi:hypothetical protein